MIQIIKLCSTIQYVASNCGHGENLAGLTDVRTLASALYFTGLFLYQAACTAPAATQDDGRFSRTHRSAMKREDQSIRLSSTYVRSSLSLLYNRIF